MDLTSLKVVLWQVCLIEAIICLILLVGVILATSTWRIAIRRAVAGVSRGALAKAKREAGAEAEEGAVTEAEREAGALRRFSSTMAEYAMHLRRRTSAVRGTLGYTMSSLTKRRKRRAGTSERFHSDMAKYAAHLKNHAIAIHGLNQTSQELKEEVRMQHRALSDLAMAIEKAPGRAGPTAEPRLKPVVSERMPPMEEEKIAAPEKGAQISGHLQYRRQPTAEQEIAAEGAAAKKPSLATRHTLATREAIASKTRLISTS